MRETKKLCYVIMPYGAENEERRDHFEMIYRLLIKDTAEQLGYTVERTDHEGQPGVITNQIIGALTEGDIVIADLSGANWNVAYELGVRHTMVKGGTILLCDSVTERAFDVESLNIIQYNAENPIKDFKSVQEKIQKAIKHCETRPMRSDNTIHNIYPFEDYMVSYLEDGDPQQQEQIERLSSQVNSLQEENKRLYATLEDAGIFSDGLFNMEWDISAEIERAFQSIEVSGDQLLYQVEAELSTNEPDYRRLSDLLKRALTEGYLDEDHFRRLYHVFQRHDLPQLVNLILRTAVQRYPKSLDFKSYSAAAYANDYRTADKALQLAFEILQVTEKDGVYQSACHKIDGDQLAACMNVLIRLNRYDLMEKIAPILIEQIPMQRELLMRNLAVAYRQLGNASMQREVLERLLQEYPMNDVNHYRAFTYFSDRDENIQAYYQIELAYALDPNDPDYILALAGLIFDDRVCRTENGVAMESRETCVSSVMPLMMLAVETDTNSIRRWVNFLQRNHETAKAELFVEWFQNGMEFHGIPDLNYTCVDYLQKLSRNLDHNLCSKLELE